MQLIPLAVSAARAAYFRAAPPNEKSRRQNLFSLILTRRGGCGENSCARRSPAAQRLRYQGGIMFKTATKKRNEVRTARSETFRFSSGGSASKATACSPAFRNVRVK